MKFLCPSCKAKYQIADEKVIGRTVKMKCRQCGHLIEINEAVIGDIGLSSARQSSLPPIPESPGDDGGQLGNGGLGKGGLGKGGLGKGGLGKGSPPPKPARSPTPAAGIPVVSPLSPPQKATVQTGARAPMAPSDRSRGSAVPVPRPVPLRSETTSPPETKLPPTELHDAENSVPSSRRASTANVTVASRGSSASSAAVGRLPGVPETVVSSLSPGAARSGPAQPDVLAGAFTKAVNSTSSQAQPADHPLAGDEWYVGIGEQPVGPIRLAEIRDRAAKGEVTPECLVWRDGFEDWKPLTAFPELVAVVEEGIASYRSLRPPPPSIGASVADPLQASRPTDQHSAAMVPPTSQASSSAFDEDALAAAGIAKPKIPLAAWLAIAMALVLGVTIGLVVMKPDPPKEVVKYVEVPVSAKPLVGEVPPPAPLDRSGQNAEPVNGDGAGAADKRSASGTRKPASSGVPESPGAAASNEVSQGLKGLQGLQGLGAPRTGPASEVGAAAAGRQQLDSATLSRTVSRYTASVKRSCWQPALDTRAPDASTSARISANIVVAPSGKVQSVTVSPDPKGYRGLSTCIQARVRNWEFPPAGGPTEFNVPFVFAAQ